MTNNIGKVKKHKRKFQYLSNKGARIHRQDFIESSYINGVYNSEGEQVIRPLSDDEREFLDSYYKEFVHSTFITDAESNKLFKIAKKLTKDAENVKFYNENGFFPENVELAISKFNEKSKSLGNLAYSFWDQREINSDDYKRRYDIQNSSQKGLSVESFEEMQYISNFDEEIDTTIEDLITESEES
jgi:hypothetical protein